MAEEYKDDGRRGAEGGAQIYEDKKGGIPWWAWLLLGLLLLGLLWFLLSNRGTSPAATSTPPAQTAPAQTAPAQTAPVPTSPAPPVAAATTNGQPVPPGPPAATANNAVPAKDIKIHSGTDITTAKPAQATVPGVPLSDVAKITAAADPLSLAGQRAKLTNVTVRRVISDRAFFVGPSDSQQMLVLLDKGLNAGTSAAAKVTITQGQPVSLVGVIEKLPTPEALSQTYALSGDNLTALESQKAYLHATVAQQK